MKTHSVLAVLALLAVPAVSSLPAHAANMEPMSGHETAMSGSMLNAYMAADAKAAIEAGKPVLIWFHKMGCPTCAAQQPTVEGFLKQHGGLMAYKVNFSDDKAANEMYGVNMQSTLIVFRDGKEVARSTGETDSSKLNELLGKLAG